MWCTLKLNINASEPDLCPGAVAALMRYKSITLPRFATTLYLHEVDSITVVHPKRNSRAPVCDHHDQSVGSCP